MLGSTGQLNENEFSLRTGHFLTGDTVERLHNQLIAAIFANLFRDLPEPGVAPWVSANDKPVSLSKTTAGDGAEQRLKTEIMHLPTRDRKRLKDIPEVSAFASPFWFWHFLLSALCPLQVILC